MEDIDVSTTLVCCSSDNTPLVMDFSRPGKEWRCPTCGRFTEFFDDHKHLKPSQISETSKQAYIDAGGKWEPVSEAGGEKC